MPPNAQTSRLPPMPETDWEVPAITAGTPQARAFSKAFPGFPYPYRTALRVDNSRGTTRLTLVCNGVTRYVGTGSVVTVTKENVGGPIYGYTVDSSANTSLGDVVVYEDGGLTGPN